MNLSPYYIISLILIPYAKKYHIIPEKSPLKIYLGSVYLPDCQQYILVLNSQNKFQTPTNLGQSTKLSNWKLRSWELSPQKLISTWGSKLWRLGKSASQLFDVEGQGDVVYIGSGCGCGDCGGGGCGVVVAVGVAFAVAVAVAAVEF